jgi:hypothetical protein
MTEAQAKFVADYILADRIADTGTGMPTIVAYLNSGAHTFRGSKLVFDEISRLLILDDNIFIRCEQCAAIEIIPK